MIASDAGFLRVSRVTNTIILFVAAVVAVVVIAVIWGAAGGFHKAVVRGEAREELDGYSNILVEQFSSKRGILEWVGSSDEVVQLLKKKRNQQSAELEQYLNGIAAGSGASIVYVLDAAGTVIACNRYDGDNTLLGKNYAFRKYFIDAMQGEESLFAAVGVTTNERGLYLSRPVLVHGQQAPAGVAVVKLGVLAGEQVLRSMKHPTWIVSPGGIVFLSNRPDFLYKMERLLGENEMAALRESRQFADNPLEPFPEAIEENGRLFGPGERIEQRASLGIPGWTLVQWRGVPYPLHLALGLSLLALFLVGLAGLAFAIWRDRIMADQRLAFSQQLAEENMRKGYETLRRILRHLPVGVMVSDCRMNFRWANEAALLMLRYPDNEALRKAAIGSDVCIVSEKGASIADYPLDKPLTQLEGAVVLADGDTIPVLLHRVQFQAGDEPLVLYSIIDLSERKQMEAGLIQARKMESIGQLAAGVAHEINSPAQFVGSNLEFIHSSLKDLFGALHAFEKVLGNGAAAADGQGPAFAAQLASISRDADLDFLEEELPAAALQAREGIDRIAKIVKALKDFSHPGIEGKLQSVDLNAALETTLTVAGNVWQPVADIELDLSPGLPRLDCPAGELNQVFLNFIVNAAHAIEEKRLNEKSVQKGVVKIRTRRDGDHIEISFSDTGTGIPAEIQDKIFDPFFTTKEVGRGSGQGLYIARNVICDKLGGVLTFSTEPRAGTTFRVRLPLASRR